MACVCVWRIQKNDSAGSVLEGWGLRLRSGSAGALLYKAMAYRRLHVSDGVLVRSGFYISCLAVCILVNGLSNAKLSFFNNIQPRIQGLNVFALTRENFQFGVR